MPAEWIESTVGDQVLLQRGFDITKAQQRPGSVPVISSGGVSSYHSVAAAKGPGVVLGRKGVVGSVWFVREDYWPHDTTLWVKDFKGNDPRFVYFFFRWMAPRLVSLDVGSANPTLNRNHVHPTRVRWPSWSEQTRIAQVLGALDDKIDLNRRMSETMESMARALFASWFIDFDPVRAKAEGRAPNRLDLHAATASFFPDRFGDSEAGSIPAGWEVVRLAEAGVWVSGGTPSKSRPEYWGGELPWVSAKSLSDAVWVHDADMHVTALGAENGTRTVPRGSVLFVVRGMSLASEFRVGLCSREVAFNQDLKAIVPNGRVEPTVLTLWLRENRKRILELADEASHGTKRLQTDALAQLKLVLPCPAVQARIAAPLHALLERIAANDHEAETLRVTRDLLLPKLLSGELRVRDAERTVEKVA